jgi:DUF2889 family protein
MLAYSRNKSVGVQVQGDNRRVASGVLEDELYAMQCEIAVDWPSLTIESIQTRMKRFTTVTCPKAQEVFILAEGWKLGPDLEGKIKKEIGRKGCRHMAILMVDCCRAVAQAELARELQAALETEPNLDRKAFVQDFCSRYTGMDQYLLLK